MPIYKTLTIMVASLIFTGPASAQGQSESGTQWPQTGMHQGGPSMQRHANPDKAPRINNFWIP